MSANGLEIFDRSIHATNLWLKEISNEIGADRRLACRVLGVVFGTSSHVRLPAAETDNRTCGTS